MSTSFNVAVFFCQEWKNMQINFSCSYTISMHVECNLLFFTEVWENKRFSSIFSTFISFHTWFPNTPMAQADDTWLEGNHVAANWGGMPRMKICEIATIVWPLNMTHHWGRPVPKTLIQEPRQVPRDPKSIDQRSP